MSAKKKDPRKRKTDYTDAAKGIPPIPRRTPPPDMKPPKEKKEE